MFAAASKTASSSAPSYIEDVFSTYIYTGTGSAQTITNGIDLATKGGLVWTKTRSTAATDHYLIDTTRGGSSALYSNLTDAANTSISLITFNSNGYTIPSTGAPYIGVGTRNYVSWTFEKQPKFFDVVTYTGNGSATNNISHNLASVPGFIVIKRTDNTSNWCVAAGDSSGNYLQLSLNTTDQSYASASKSSIANSTTFNAGYIGVNFDGSANVNGGSYVAYLFAHNAGGFGLTGTDNVISCGSFSTGSGSGFVSLGYEPQWILAKRVDGAGNWVVIDVTRGMAVDRGLYSSDGILVPNTTAAETYSTYFDPQPTGFNFNTFSASQSWIYIAIRRGPMRTPTSGTSVFDADVSLNASFPYAGTTFVVDMTMFRGDTSALNNWNNGSRLTGGINLGGTNGGLLRLNLANAEVLDTSPQYDSNVGSFNLSSTSPIVYSFGRAPGFMDVVCYTGTGTNRTVTHNLTVTPELMIVKSRNNAYDWNVYSADVGNTKYLKLNTTDAPATDSTVWNNTSPTSSVFTVGTANAVNVNAGAYVAYLFASCLGVSKVGSYTGNGTSQTINCGFASGARFVLIKETSGTGNWTVWDTARGMTSGGSPYLFLNSTAAEGTPVYVTTTSVGFNLTTSTFNSNGVNYIFLAIA